MNGIPPCPECKGRNIHVAEQFDADGDPVYRMVCDDCGYADPDTFEEEYVAVDHWSRRVVKGYIDGDDPTDTIYDQLDELDDEVIPADDGVLSAWDAATRASVGGRRWASSACSYREERHRRRRDE